MESQSSERDFYFASLGCPKNLVDSEVMLGVLSKANYKVASNPADAGVIVINTCGFIEASKKESIDLILDLGKFKNEGRCHTLVVAGCLVQRYAQDLRKNLPEVDLFIGTGEYFRIAEHLTAKRISPQAPIHLSEPTYIHDSKTPRILLERSASAFVKIAEGCMKRCSFCIIPTMRGNLRSRSLIDIAQECWELSRQGVKEIGLVAQDLTDYGRDLKPFNRHALRDLLIELVKIKDVEWFRLFYSYPDGLSNEVITLMSDEPKLCKYVDLPLQHANDFILRRMNRAITQEKMKRLIGHLRDTVSDISIRSSFIVGFPGESDEHFLELCDFLKWAELDHVGLFQYSREEGTPSYHLDDHVEERIKKDRYLEADSILETIALKKARSQIGSKFRVLIDGPHPTFPSTWVGRNERQAKEIDSLILLNDGIDPQNPPIGNFVNVQVTDANGRDLVGKIL